MAVILKPISGAVRENGRLVPITEAGQAADLAEARAASAALRPTQTNEP